MKTTAGETISQEVTKLIQTSNKKIFGTIESCKLLLLGPSFHSIRSFFGDVFLEFHLRRGNELVREVVRFEAQLPYSGYDIRQLFINRRLLQIQVQGVREFSDLEFNQRDRSLQEFPITLSAEQRGHLKEILNAFPNVDGLPKRYRALEVNDSTVALKVLRLVGFRQSAQPPVFPMLLPWYFRKMKAQQTHRLSATK